MRFEFFSALLTDNLRSCLNFWVFKFQDVERKIGARKQCSGLVTFRFSLTFTLRNIFNREGRDSSTFQTVLQMT